MVYGHHVPITSIVFPRHHKVCAAAAFNPAGGIRIDAWGIEFNGNRFHYKVKSFALIEEINAYLKFRCEYEEFGLLKPVNLVFFTREHRWETE